MSKLRFYITYVCLFYLWVIGCNMTWFSDLYNLKIIKYVIQKDFSDKPAFWFSTAFFKTETTFVNLFLVISILWWARGGDCLRHKAKIFEMQLIKYPPTPTTYKVRSTRKWLKKDNSKYHTMEKFHDCQHLLSVKCKCYTWEGLYFISEISTVRSIYYILLDYYTFTIGIYKYN